MNLYTRYYECVANLRANPQDWFIYSGAAYEAIRELAKIAPMAAYELELKLKTELKVMGINLGDLGLDKYHRSITQDWYGTYFTASNESIEFIRQKYEQYRRVNVLLMKKRIEACNKYDKADNICKTSHKPTQSRINRNEAYDRIGELDKLSTIIWQCLQNYRRNFEVEFNILGI